MSLAVSLRGIGVTFGLGAVLALTGCGSGTPAAGGSASPGATAQAVGVAVTGTVHGGQQPITGATVNLYIAGNSGYGAASPLSASTAATTDSNGRFSIPNTFTCPSPNAQVYIVAKGGNVGSTDNSTTVLMSALGNCATLGAGTVANVSETTTVASVYALAQFMTPGSTAVGTSSTNITGLVNAFSTIANLVDSSSGAVRSTTPAGNGTVPQSNINTLANILSACVDAKVDGVCQQLFSLAAPAGAAAPTDTLSALLDIALNPGHNVAQLYALSQANTPYQPSLTGSPADWTLSIEYTGGGLKQPQLLAVDASGNIWIPNAGYPGTLSEFSPAGAPLSGANGFGGGGLSNPLAVAIDLTGNIWSANLAGGISEHASNGTPLSGTSGYATTALDEPVAIALDAAGNVFACNQSNNKVTKLNPSGTPVAQFAGGSLDIPYAVAIDAAQNVWIANKGANGPGNTVSKFSNTGTPANLTGYSGGGIYGPVGIAIDAAGNAWIANYNQSSISELNSTGTPLSGAGYATPAPVSAVAVDGNNTVWTANTDGSISRFSASGTPISPSTGYISPGATGEVGIALDASGNVWTTDNSVNSIFEYIGAASPTITPLQLAIKNNTVGQRP